MVNECPYILEVNNSHQSVALMVHSCMIISIISIQRAMRFQVLYCLNIVIDL
jgi:hypothetical protein